jgi:outer membrane protein TolC
LITAIFSTALLVGGCTSIDPARGLADVRALTPEAPGDALVWIQSSADLEASNQRVAQLLDEALTPDSAVQIALLNNKGLQASFAEIGIAQADLLQAGRLANPGFSFARTSQGEHLEIERGLHFNLMSLMLRPQRQAMESRRYAQVQRVVASEVQMLMSETRKAFFDAVASAQRSAYMSQVMQAAQAGAELARRMERAGNFSKLQQAREQSFHADATQSLARARRVEISSRERLTRLMGLSSEQTRFQLPDRLPDLPIQARDLPNIEQTAMDQRLDVQGAKLAAEQSASNLGLTRVTRFINVLEYGRLRNTASEGTSTRGWEVRVELPLFDWGTARVAKAESLYMQALHRATQAATNARSEVREAYGHYRAAYDIAKHQRDEVVPLKKRISEENLLRYNGMYIGVFELLADARAQIHGVAGYIDALHDYWVAEADLDMAMVGKPRLTPPTAVNASAEAAGAAH